MAGLNFTTFTGALTIGTTSMHCAAWDILDLRALWLPSAVRGADRLIPGAAGVRPKRRRRTVTTHSLPFLISGLADATGVGACSEADRVRQLEVNVYALRSAVLDPTNVGDGTRAATLVLPSGATLTADIHVLGFTEAAVSPDSLFGTLDISIPSGVFA